VTNLKGLVSRSSSDILAVVEAAWTWTIVRMRSGGGLQCNVDDGVMVSGASLQVW